MRIGFTIVFNGLHHLLHNDYAYKMMQMFDIWAIVEGAANSSGSTKWCKEMPEKYHKNGRSIDGTPDFIHNKLAMSYDCYVVIDHINHVAFDKDDMVNYAIEHILEKFNERYNKSFPIFLWQIDIDEQWTPEAMDAAEKELVGDTGIFLADYHVGPGLMAKDQRPYKRLWRWKGQRFASHEPPLLEGGNGTEQLLSQRFQHYAYYFEKDVIFKNDWYGGHAGIHKRWLELQKETDFPQPLSRLLPRKTGEICRI